MTQEQAACFVGSFLRGGDEIPNHSSPAPPVFFVRRRHCCTVLFAVQAVGEPPFFMAASAFFAIKDAVASARKDHGDPAFFRLNSPASSERLVRLAPRPNRSVVAMKPLYFFSWT